MVVVTGANGFIGAHAVIACAQKGKSVVGFIRKNADKTYFESLVAFYKLSKETLQYISWQEIDYFDYAALMEALKHCKQIVHCAGKISFDSRLKDELVAINRDTTEILINACLDVNCTDFVYLSSIAACSYEENKDGNLSNRFDSTYGLSKFLGELEVIRGKFENPNLKCTIVRPGVVTGPPPKNNDFRKTVKWIHKGMAFCGKGSTGFIEVTDLSQHIVNILDGATESQEKIAVGKNISFEALTHAIAEQLQVKAQVKVLSNTALKWIGKLTGLSRLFGKPQALPKSAVAALTTNSNYPELSFANIKNTPETLVASMVNYLKSSGNL